MIHLAMACNNQVIVAQKNVTNALKLRVKLAQPNIKMYLIVEHKVVGHINMKNILVI